MWGNPFEHIVRDLITFGVVIGLAIAGLIWLAVWVFSHLSITWL